MNASLVSCISLIAICQLKAYASTSFPLLYIKLNKMVSNFLTYGFAILLSTSLTYHLTVSRKASLHKSVTNSKLASAMYDSSTLTSTLGEDGFAASFDAAVFIVDSIAFSEIKPFAGRFM